MMKKRLYILLIFGISISAFAQEGVTIDSKLNTMGEYLIRQYRNASGSYGGLFMEWGADYVSGNGGGYTFRTSSGDCIKATGTPLLSGCTSEIYRGIAYNEAQYLNHRCFASLKSYIVDFCRAP